MSLNDVRLKLEDELTPQDIQVLKENLDELTDEDKEAYKGVLSDEQTITEDEPDQPEEDINAGEETEAEETSDSTTDEPAQEKLDKEAIAESVLERIKGILPGKKEEKDDDPEKTDEDKFKELPEFKNWSDVLKFVDKVAEERVSTALAADKEQARKQQEEYNKALNEVNEQIDALSGKEGFPEKDTKEFESAKNQIFDIAKKYKHGTVEEAFETWKIIPKQYGGGFQAQTTEPMTEEQKQQQQEIVKKEQEAKSKQALRNQKKAAAKVGGGSGGAAGSDGYSFVPGQSTDDMLDDILSILE